MNSADFGSRNKPVTDEDLVRSFQSGERDSFEELVIRNQDRIVSLCRWFLCDYEDACDAAQDVFIKVYKGLDNFRFEAAFSTWLYKIAVNTCKNRINSLEYRFKRFMLRLQGVSGDQAQHLKIPDNRPDPEEKLGEKERRLLIQNAIGRLSPKYRTVVVLRDVEGLSYEEVAEAAGLNLGTVKSRLARGRKALFESLRNIFGDEMQQN
jgi:RNA polymerase sigma-70 factor (ECF subfamily)